jgi:hypothetical protein
MGTMMALSGVSAASGTLRGRWVRELIRRGKDPLCGAEIWQLTSAAVISHDIYGEQLYCSADGTRIAFLRCSTTDIRDGAMELYVADLHQKGVKRLGAAAFFLVGGNGRQDTLFYVRRGDKDVLSIVRVNFTTLEQTEVFRFGKCPPPEFRGLLAVSPDERYCMIIRRLGERRYGIERIDLKNGTWQLIHEKDDIFNGHLQFNPAGGELMVQQNRGGLLDENFNSVRSTGPKDATLYLIDQDGNERPTLPVGLPYTPPVSGHECFLGETGRVLLTTHGSRIYTAAPGDKKATLIARGNGFIHITASPDGKFFVVDNIHTGRLHLGCVATGKVLPLCDTGASGGSPQYTHTHPYITPGNHRVVFNSDRTGIPQVYVARIPTELLAQVAG